MVLPDPPLSTKEDQLGNLRARAGSIKPSREIGSYSVSIRTVRAVAQLILDGVLD